MTDWPDALADALLPAGRDGRPALLSCTDTTLKVAAADAGAQADPAAALVDVVRDGGGLTGAARVAARWRRAARPRPAPPYLPALAVCVLAASRMGEQETSANAYYARLAELLGPADRPGHPPYDGFAELMAAGFPALAEWMADDQQGRRGLLHNVDPPASRRHVGVPIGHAVLRAADLRWLGRFFWERRRHLEAGWDPAGTLLHHPARRQITGPARELLEDASRRPLLSAALHAARCAWDGARADVDGRRVLAAILTAQLDALAGALYLAVRVDGLADDEAGNDPHGAPVLVPRPPDTLSIPLHWLERATDGPARVLLDGRRAVHALPGPLVLFAVGDGGFEEVPVATEPVWALTCRHDIHDGDRVDVDLPDGWRLLADVPPEALPNDRRAPDPDCTVPQALAVIAGLPLGDGAWLAERAPTIAGPPDLDAPLMADGAPLDHLRPGHSFRLRALDGRPGVHVLTADQERLDLHLADTAAPDGTGQMGWRLDDPTLTAHGPGDLDDTAATAIRGALIDDGRTPAPPSAEPWIRSFGAVWALDAEGMMRALAPPDTDGWLRTVGVTHRDAWPLPAGTVWACQPGRRTVTLVDAAAGPVRATEGAAQCVQFFADAQVLDPSRCGDAQARWDRLCEACREAELV